MVTIDQARVAAEKREQWGAQVEADAEEGAVGQQEVEVFGEEPCGLEGQGPGQTEVEGMTEEEEEQAEGEMVEARLAER